VKSAGGLQQFPVYSTAENRDAVNLRFLQARLLEQVGSSHA
jgi:hypothetical protein